MTPQSFSRYRFLITGITSIHGWPIFRFFEDKYPGRVWGIKNVYAPKPTGKNIFVANIEDELAVLQIIKTVNPTHIIHCAGMCDLDQAEYHPERAQELNVKPAGYLKEHCSQLKLIYLSYDLVYSGKENDGKGYSEKDIPDPLTVVGKSILDTENIFRTMSDHLIIRLGLPMGQSIQRNKGAVDWIHSRFRKNRIATLLYDEVRSTINLEDLSPAVDILLSQNGVFHLGSRTKRSLYQMGQAILKAHNYPNHLLEGKTRKEFPAIPPRMGDVSLHCEKAYSILNWIPSGWPEGCYLGTV